MDGSKLGAGFVLVCAMVSLVPVSAQERENSSTDPVSADTVARESAPVTRSDRASTAQSAAPTSGNWWSDIDADADGKISAVEAKANAGLDMRFMAIDADHDGFVKLEEYRTFFESNVGRNP